MNDSSSLVATIEAFVKSTIAASGLIPARSESFCIELIPSDVDDVEVDNPRLSFLRKLSDRAIVAEKTNVCLFFLCKLGIVLQVAVGWEDCSTETLSTGSLSIIDCSS